LQKPCNGDSGQNWRLVPAQEVSYFVIENAASGLLLQADDNEQESRVNGGKRAGAPGQEWALLAQ